VLLSRPDGAGQIEKALHENDVEPATELVPDLPEMGGPEGCRSASGGLVAP
jgi:hypothetical protein